MTDNEILARWQGLKNVRSTRLSNGATAIIYNSNTIVPDYLNNDAAAMRLLDTLVEKNYYPEVFYCLGRKWSCTIAHDGGIIAAAKSLHRSEAIVAACLEVARKEQEGNE